MKRFTSFTAAPAAFAIFFLPTHLIAPAYLDPGTGSLLIQLAIGALVGGWFLVKTYWARIKSFFSNHFAAAKKDENSQD